jgi:hypothetical protein
MIKIYDIIMSFINTEKELIPEHHIINYDEYHKVENNKELREIMKNLVDANIDENRDWIKEQVEPKGLKVQDKTYLYYNDCNPTKFWVAERCAEDKDQNCITIVRAEAIRITKDDALECIKTVN